MPKKKSVKKKANSPKEDKKVANLTFGQKAADAVSTWAGSWTFIISLLVIMFIWMWVNVAALAFKWDPYPFILLNFVLSTLAALQAPVILMSQNRQEERDRAKAERDYATNRKSERENQKILGKLDYIEQKLNEMSKKRK